MVRWWLSSYSPPWEPQILQHGSVLACLCPCFSVRRKEAMMNVDCFFLPVFCIGSSETERYEVVTVVKMSIVVFWVIVIINPAINQPIVKAYIRLGGKVYIFVFVGGLRREMSFITRSPLLHKNTPSAIEEESSCASEPLCSQWE
jgi:hypothetical protein